MQLPTNYFKKNLNCGELSVLSHPGVLDSFFNPLLKINWYVHDSEELDYKNFVVSYILDATPKDRPSVNPEPTTIGKIVQAEGIWVTFSYKERNQYPIRLSVPVERFIELLIQHILPNNFRQIRYYVFFPYLWLLLLYYLQLLPLYGNQFPPPKNISYKYNYDLWLSLSLKVLYTNNPFIPFLSISLRFELFRQ